MFSVYTYYIFELEEEIARRNGNGGRLTNFQPQSPIQVLLGKQESESFHANA